MIREREIKPLSGVFMLFFLIVLAFVLMFLFVGVARAHQPWASLGWGQIGRAHV